jgi:hypothetical protein
VLVLPGNTYDGELDVGGPDFAAKVVDVLDPLVVVVEVVGGDADDLDIALCKVLRAARDLAELSRADRCEICSMNEYKLVRLDAISDRNAPPGWENRTPWKEAHGQRQDGETTKVGSRTQESPSHSWNFIGPMVVSASKSGAMLPRRRVYSCLGKVDMVVEDKGGTH